MRRGFTLIELVVAVAILALMSSFAGAIFSVSIDSHRTAMANAEIMRKLRAITDQLNADFSGLRKDGEIFVVWTAEPAEFGYLIDWESYADDPDGHVRFDKIMFFANGDFQAYWDGDIRGDVARITYMLANSAWADPDPNTKPPLIRREQRILTRTQHILTSDPDLDAWVDPSVLAADEARLDEWRNRDEYDRITMQRWKNMLWEDDKKIALSVATDVDVDQSGFGGGAVIQSGDPTSTHMFFCEGVGEFSVQGWHDRLERWVPEVAEGDFDLPEPYVPGVLYPYRALDRGGGVTEYIGGLALGGVFEPNEPYHFPGEQINEERFNEIPGLGRALKFTFTLYDSKGIIKEGRTFTHIVYLDS